MLGNGSMNAEDYWLRLPGQASYSKRPRPPFNPNVRHIHWIRHFGPFIPSRSSWLRDAAHTPDVTFLRRILSILFDDLTRGNGEANLPGHPGLYTGPDSRIWADAINIFDRGTSSSATLHACAIQPTGRWG